MLASAHFNGPYKKQLRRGKKLYYSHQCQLVWHAAVSSIHLPIQKKHLIIVISPCLERETFPDMWPGHAEVSQTWARGRKRPQMPHVLHSFTCTFKQRHVYSTVVDLTPPPHASFCSSHLLWSKAFPAHLLSPVRWLSNNSCYLVNRWESELKLFRKSLRFGLSTVNSASQKPSWKAYVNRD